jgi:LL-diaminopimelate aminotransferase
MNIDISKRLKKLPPYLFAEIDRQKKELRERNVDFIDLSIGDPDIAASQQVIDTLYSAAKIKENQKYALDGGKKSLRSAIKNWSRRRFNIDLDEDKEILPLIGSKEGLVHFPLGFVDKGDYVIIPNPGYPGYRGAAIFAGAKTYELPLLEENSFLPILEKIPLSVRNKARIIYLNYPNNPTSMVAPLAFLEGVVKFCTKYGIILAYDNAYSEIYFEQKPHSILEVKEAKDVAIEFHSLSKTFCMTGFRIGWAAGNQHLVNALLKVKTNIDSGIFGAIQDAATLALEKEAGYVDNLRKIFKERRDIFFRILSRAGFKKTYAQSTFYVWAKLPEKFKSSIDFARYLIEKKNIIATPGVGFGKYGERFMRFALTVDKDVLQKVFKDGAL